MVSYFEYEILLPDTRSGFRKGKMYLFYVSLQVFLILLMSFILPGTKALEVIECAGLFVCVLVQPTSICCWQSIISLDFMIYRLNVFHHTTIIEVK